MVRIGILERLAARTDSEIEFARGRVFRLGERELPGLLIGPLDHSLHERIERRNFRATDWLDGRPNRIERVGPPCFSVVCSVRVKSFKPEEPTNIGLRNRKRLLALLPGDHRPRSRPRCEIRARALAAACHGHAPFEISYRAVPKGP